MFPQLPAAHCHASAPLPGGMCLFLLLSLTLPRQPRLSHQYHRCSPPPRHVSRRLQQSPHPASRAREEGRPRSFAPENSLQ